MRLTWIRPRHGPKPWSDIDHHAQRLASRPARPELADRAVEPAEDLARRGIHRGVVDGRLVDAQIPPGAVLERVEVLELDHQGRPVGEHLIGDPRGTVALDGGRGPSWRRRRWRSSRRGFQAGRAFPDRADVVRGSLGPGAGGRTRGWTRCSASRCGAVDAGDDQALHFRRRVRHRHVEADDRPPGVGEDLPERSRTRTRPAWLTRIRLLPMSK